LYTLLRSTKWESTLARAANLGGETEQSNEYGETRNEGIKHRGKSRGVLK
jgi:hypothetical protein